MTSKLTLVPLVLASLALGSLALTASPAQAAPSAGQRSRPPSAGGNCVGRSCDTWALIGAIPPGTGTNTVAPPPPPCQVAPVGNAQAGSQSVISFYQGATQTAQDQSALAQAQQLATQTPVPAGEWYQVIATAPADQAQCAKLPLFVWQAGTGTNALRKVGLPVQPGTLAALLYRTLNLAQVGKVTLSPQPTSDTNLPTAVQFALTPAPDSPLFLNAKGNPYVVASAVTALGAATVWATVAGLTINPGTTDAATFNSATTCTQAHPGPNGTTIMLGSRDTTAELAKVGAGGTIDCGATYETPGTYNLTVSVNWTACWIPGPPTVGGPPANCQPVPGAQTLQPSTSGPVPVTVRTITANNG